MKLLLSSQQCVQGRQNKINSISIVWCFFLSTFSHLISGNSGSQECEEKCVSVYSVCKVTVRNPPLYDSATLVPKVDILRTDLPTPMRLSGITMIYYLFAQRWDGG